MGALPLAMSELTRRRGIALVALAGLFVSTYLYLYATGFYGELACGANGGCDVVQASRWSSFLGFPVAGWGVGWYAACFAAALFGVRASASTGGGASAGAGESAGGGVGGARRGSAWIPRALAALAVGGIGFTVYLTALELFVIHAICRWCVGSAVLTLFIFLLALPEFRGLRQRA